MLENLTAFRQRTAFVWDSLPPSGRFVTNPRLGDKVGPDGKLLPFHGDTVIFDLPEEDRAWLRDLQAQLENACGAMLADPLPPDSFHITLHDLHSSPRLDDISARMREARSASQALLAALGPVCVSVRPTAVFSMVNISVVLGFEPASEEDCAALMALYERFQQIVPLDYPLTPHVTLAYYRPGDYGEAGLRALHSAVADLTGRLTPRLLRLTAPRYCRFSDMSRYLPDLPL